MFLGNSRALASAVSSFIGFSSARLPLRGCSGNIIGSFRTSSLRVAAFAAQHTSFHHCARAYAAMSTETMDAGVVEELGGPENVLFKRIPVPVVRDDEVEVEVFAAGVNFIDTYFRTGLYPATSLPVVLGREAAGVVSAIGKNAAGQGIRVGDRVCFLGEATYAEKATVKAERAIRVPDGLSFDDAVALLTQGMTARMLAHSVYPLGPNDTCLVHAGAGGTGALLIQVAKIYGAKVITTVSTEEKAQLARESGADEVIIYTKEDFEARTKELTGGRGVDVVYDSVGKTTYEGSINVVRPRGYVVFFGNSSGPVPPIDPLALNRRGSLFLTRPGLYHYVEKTEELQESAAEVFGWFLDGKVKTRVAATVPLREAASAHALLESRKATGKILIHPRG